MNNKQLFVLLGAGIGIYFLTRSKTQSFYSTMVDIVESTQNQAAIIMGKQTRGERNNNPGNIRPAGYTWQGQTGIDSGSMGSYVIFSSPVWGIRAIAKDLLTKYGRGLDTVRKIITAYAPPSENPTESYIQAVTRELGVLSITPLNLRDISTLTKFVYAIIKHENGRVIYTPAQIAEGVSMAINS